MRKKRSSILKAKHCKVAEREAGTHTGQKADARVAAYGAELLVSALENEAFERRHTATRLAAAIGIHAAHWYRLRAAPELLARCERKTQDRIAAYLSWPIGRVLTACGVIGQSDFELMFGGRDIVLAILEQLERSAFGASLRIPLEQAARDHQTLIAELFVAWQAEKLKEERQSFVA